jgi:hypothetical protein
VRALRPHRLAQHQRADRVDAHQREGRPHGRLRPLCDARHGVEHDHPGEEPRRPGEAAEEHGPLRHGHRCDVVGAARGLDDARSLDVFFGKTIDETTPGNGGGWTIDTVAKNGAKRRDWNGNGNPGQTGATDVRSAQVYGADTFAAFSSQASRTYTTPIKSGCQKNIIIYVGNGDPGSEPTNPSISAKLASIGGDATIIKNLAGSDLHSSFADEYARFLWDKKGIKPTESRSGRRKPRACRATPTRRCATS